MLFTSYRNVIILKTIFVFTELQIQSLPINNGFSIKFNPISLKEAEEGTPKMNDVLFAKIPQELPVDVAQKVFSSEMFPRSLDLATGCSNEIARIIFPIQSSYSELNDTIIQNQVNFINVPVMKQDASDYKILVVSAPYNVKLGKDKAQPMFVYIVFPMDNRNDQVNIPSVYFVNKSDGKLNLKSKEKVDPILIIDNNRIVTGLKSKEVSKFVKFKNKFTKPVNVEINQSRV